MKDRSAAFEGLGQDGIGPVVCDDAAHSGPLELFGRPPPAKQPNGRYTVGNESLAKGPPDKTVRAGDEDRSLDLRETGFRGPS